MLELAFSPRLSTVLCHRDKSIQPGLSAASSRQPLLSQTVPSEDGCSLLPFSSCWTCQLLAVRFFWAQLFSMVSRFCFLQYVQKNVGFVPSWLTSGMALVALFDPAVFCRCEHSAFSAGAAALGVLGQREDLFYPLQQEELLLCQCSSCKHMPFCAVHDTSWITPLTVSQAGEAQGHGYITLQLPLYGILSLFLSNSIAEPWT